MSQSSSHLLLKKNVTRATASAIVAAAIQASADRGIDVAVAVTDPGGHLMAFERSDNSRVLAIDVAINKAWTSAVSGMSTQTWNALFAAHPAVAPLAGHPRLLGVAGGLPLIADGEVIGAVGVSGGSHDDDHEVASSAIRALDFDVPR
jgi:uncharacterized protein GlcG (DUF336 family)